MRLLLGSETYYPEVNGASYFTQRLASGLLANGHDVAVVCPSRSARSHVEQTDGLVTHRVASIPTPLYTAYRLAPLPFAYRAIREAVLRTQPDVIHIQNHFFVGRALASIAHRLEIPVVATNHFVPDHILVHIDFLPRRWREAGAAALWRDARRVYTRAHAITTPTRRSVELMQLNGFDRPIAALSCGIDRERFHPRNRGDAIRERYELGDRPTYLHVGRLDKDKHVRQLIDALPLVRRAVDARLLVVGQGKLLPALQAAAEAAGVADAVVFTGFLPDRDLPGAYAASDVFCTAGTAELQSIATMEAMASGKPIVAVDRLALPHLVGDGYNGYTFPADDAPALADRLTALLAHPDRRRAMGARSLEIIAPHDVERIVADYEEIYRSVANGALHESWSPDVDEPPRALSA